MTAVDDRKATPEEQIAQRFARDTKDHKMTVLHDDGLYRHLRFQQEVWRPPLLKPLKSGCYWFDLITAPDMLVFRGDGDSFVFHRDTDMFAFFRLSAWKGQPNYSYWAQKLTSTADVQRYDQDLMAAQVRQLVNEFLAEHVPDEPEPSVPVAASGIAERVPGEKLRDFVPVLEKTRQETDVAKRLRAEVQYEILDALTGDYSLDLDTVGRFRFHIKLNPSHRDYPDFEISDPWELPVKEFDWWYMWACHAIVWGIRTYDASLPKEHVTSWWQRPLALLGIKTAALCGDPVLPGKVPGPTRKCRECQRSVGDS